MDARGGLAERIYRALLTLYPPAFRLRFADEMVQLFGDQLRDAQSRDRPLGVMTAWFRILGDLLVTAASEHVRGDGEVGRSLQRPPTAITRILAVAGIIGGVVLVAVFVVDIPPELNVARIVLFNVGAIGIALGLYRRIAAVTPRLALAVTAAALVANGWYIAMELLSIGRPVFPEADPEFRLVAFYAAVAMWLADAAVGVAIWRTGAAARWMGAVLAIASVIALTGIDRFELVRGGWAWLFLPAALAAIGVSGLAWIALGIDLATRRRRVSLATGSQDREA